jgi:hypothetical protein
LAWEARPIRGKIGKFAEISLFAADKPNMDITSIGLQGLGDAEARFQKAAARISDAATGGPVDAVDLSTETVNLLTAKDQFLTDLKTTQAGQEMDRQTLDILA